MIPQATLAIESHPMNPPKPLGVGVLVDGKLIAVMPLDELRRAAAHLAEMEKARLKV